MGAAAGLQADYRERLFNYEPAEYLARQLPTKPHVAYRVESMKLENRLCHTIADYRLLLTKWLIVSDTSRLRSYYRARPATR